jgi:2-C-methyl-D-erythritol 4-phosphate cytidylyltransferase
MSVTAVVIVDDHDAGPHPLTLLAGTPLVTHAVRCLLDSSLVDRVVVLDHLGRADDVLAACSGLPVSVRAAGAGAGFGTHADQRHAPRSGDASITDGPAEVLLLHDAARPLAPAALAVAVVDAVRSGCAAAIPVLPMPDTVKRVDAAGLVQSSVDRATLRVLQTPHAVRRDLFSGPPLRAALGLAAAGWPVRTVPGDALAFAVHSAWDLTLAELLLAERVGRAGKGPGRMGS